MKTETKKNLVPLETKFESPAKAKEYLEKIGFESEDGRFWFMPHTRNWALYMESIGKVSYFYNEVKGGRKIAQRLQYVPPKKRKPKQKEGNTHSPVN